GRLLIRREVAAAGEDLGAFEIGTGDADFDLAPRAVLLGVRRAVGEAVLRADLCDDLVVARLAVLHRRRAERLAAGRLGTLLQLRALLDAAARVLEEPDRVDGDIRRPDQRHQVAEADRAV